MELKDIKAIIDLMRKNDLSVFEMEKDGFKLKLVKGPNGQPIITAPIALAPFGGAPGAGINPGGPDTLCVRVVVRAATVTAAV